MKDFLPIALFIALALLGYDDYRVRRDLAETKERVKELEQRLDQQMQAVPNGAQAPGQPALPGNWLDQRLNRPNPLDAPPTQSGGGGGRGRGGQGGGGPGGGGPGGGRGGPPR